MIERAESIRVMCPLFQAEEDGSTPISALSAKDLTIEGIAFDQAKALNRRWHSRLPLFRSPLGPTTFLCFGATAADICYAVAIWSNPVARILPQDTWLELRRLATAPDAPRNTCSRMLRIMELLIRKKRSEIVKLISYQDTEVHTGGIYRAAGWKQVVTNRNGVGWDCSSRHRPKAQSEAVKCRWEKDLVPAPPAAPPRA